MLAYLVIGQASRETLPSLPIEIEVGRSSRLFGGVLGLGRDGHSTLRLEVTRPNAISGTQLALGFAGGLVLAGLLRGATGGANRPAGDAARGRRLLDQIRNGAPDVDDRPRGYDALKDYRSLWDQGRSDSLLTMRGYRLGAHTGVVAELGAWQPYLADYDLIVLNSSAGKDSMAMMVVMKALADVQGVTDRLHVVHADLGSAEHPGVRELAEDQAKRLGLPFHVVARTTYGVRRDLLDRFLDNMQDKFLVIPTRSMESALTRLGFSPRGNTAKDQVWELTLPKEHRARIEAVLLQGGYTPKLNEEGEYAAMGDPQGNQYLLRRAGGFPGFGTRYCTSEFKTAEVTKWITAFIPTLGLRRSRPARVLNVLGLRAEESDKRAGPGFKRKDKYDTTVREVREWLPIQTLTVGDVWDLIAASGLPHHAAYDVGFERLSCRLCPLAGDEDVALAALVYPGLTKKIVEMESEYGMKFKEKRTLSDVIARGLRLDPALPQKAARARAELGL